jgi:pimeloyl-ACP methyl ester carboxylesterase
MKTRALLAGLATGTLALGLLPGSALADPPATAPGGAKQAAAPGGAKVKVPARYAKQSLAWQACAPDEEDPVAKRVQCALMTVPRDWNNPDAGVDLKIAVSRLRPEKGTPQGSIVGNPGGPGGPGLGMPVLLAERPALAAKFELVGFDPRGTGASTNVTCDGAPNPGAVDARDRDRAVLDLVANASKLYGEYCRVRSGRLLDYVTTEQTVKDIDLLRGLLGRKQIHFLGYSGGTWMGAYYATYFPKQTGRFVLDSNTQFTGAWNKTFELQPLGFERRFRQDFAPWAAKYDAQLHLGTSAAGVRQFYEKLRADLKRMPIELNLGFVSLTIDQNAVDYAIIGAVYSKTGFQPLAEDLRMLRELWDDLQSGGPAAAQKAFDQAPAARKASLATSAKRAETRSIPLSPDAASATFNAITCNDTVWPRGQAYLDRISAVQGPKYPLVGWSLNQNPCGYWDRPSLAMPTPTGKGAPTTLMLQSRHDPATPYEGAIVAHQRFAGSRLVTVANEGDHGVYISGNPCVDAIADAFLTTGKAPAKDTTCQGVPIPPPSAPSLRAAASKSPLERAAHYGELLSARLR